MSTATTSFTEAFNSRYDRIRNRLASRKAAFAKAIEANPAEAIKTHATGVAESQYEVAAWDYAASAYLAKVGDGKFRNHKEAIEAAIASLTQHVLVTSTSGQYTSGFYNALTHAELVGTRDAIDELSCLANHPAA